MTIGDPNDFNSTYYDWPVPQQQQTVRQRELSTWGEAIVAAATNDVAMMYQLLDGEHDDGLGVDLRTFRTSKADVNFVKTHRNIVIDPFYTLAEIAIERDHFAIVAAITEGRPKKQEASEFSDAPPPVARSVSTFVGGSLADHVRDLMASRLQKIDDGSAASGICVLNLPQESRHTFLLPREVMELPIEQRRVAVGLLLEDPYSMESIEKATSWWKTTLGSILGVPADSPEMALPPFGLHALYTSGDGNCLLHAACLATLGVRDTREAEMGEPGACDLDELTVEKIAPRRTMRAAMHHSLLNCTALRELLASHGCILEGGVSGHELPPPPPPVAATATATGAASSSLPEAGSLPETLEGRSRLHGNAVDPPHLLVLAHVLRRPIICYASADPQTGEVRDPDSGRSYSSYAAKGERMSGVYLPHLLPPSECSPEPLAIAYSPGHFSVVVCTESAADEHIWNALNLQPPARPAAPLPLVDETLTPLPVLFPPPPPPGSNALQTVDHEQRLIERYMRVYSATISTPGDTPDMVEVKSLPITGTSVPARDRSPIGPAQCPSVNYFETVWTRRVNAALQPADPSEGSSSATTPPAGRPSAPLPVTREDSDTQMARAIEASLLEMGSGGRSTVEDDSALEPITPHKRERSDSFGFESSI